MYLVTRQERRRSNGSRRVCACVQGLDIGPESLKSFQAELQDCKTVIWNGPMGVFEMEAFVQACSQALPEVRHPNSA